MIDDDEQGLRESPSHGVAEPEEDGSNIDELAASTMKRPGVTVVVKRRRGTAERQGDQDVVQVVRVPRVYQVRTAAPTPSRAQPAVAPERDNRRAGEADPSAVVQTLPARRRRARRDPTHAPGEVTRTVFEASPPMPVARRPRANARLPEFMDRAEVGYEQVMADLQEVRAKLDLALSALRFRIG